MSTITELSQLTPAQMRGEQIDADIDLSNASEITAGTTLNCTGSIDLRSLTTLPEGVSLTAGGSIDLKSRRIHPKNNPAPMSPILTWPNGDYACADGILMRVTSRRGNVYRGLTIGHNKPIYLVTDGKNCAHGATLAEARADLAYKVSGKKPEDYKHLKLGSRLSFADAVACYRTITGACAFGVRSFVSVAALRHGDNLPGRDRGIFVDALLVHEAFAKFFRAPA